MVIQFTLLLIIIHGFATLTLSNDSSGSIYNNNSLSSPSTPPFTAKILDHNNKDITSSFQILLYSQRQQRQQDHNDPPPPNPPSTSSSPSPHNRRRVLTRLINNCFNHQQFISSHCNALDDTPGALQAYTLVCRHNPSGGPPNSTVSRNVISRRPGACEPHEICIDGTSQIAPSNANARYRHETGRGGDGGAHTVTVPTAMCVTDNAFQPLGPNWENESVADFWAAAVGLTGDADAAPAEVRAVMSRLDRSTPMEVDRLAIVGKASSSMNGGVGGENMQEETAVCRDCVGLGMKVDGAEGLRGLKVEARLLTAVEVGVAGVLWVAAMSG